MANQYTLKNGGYEPFIGNFGLVPQPPIPEPDAEDNGKVLGVSNGAYALVNGGGGASGMVVELLMDERENSYLDCPSNELYDAFNSGTNLVVVINSVTGRILEKIFYASSITERDSTSYLFYVGIPNNDITGIEILLFEGYDDTNPILVEDEPSPDSPK